MLLPGAYALVMLYPTLAVNVKRCHDRGRSGWFVLVGIVPLLNYWYLIEICFLPGTEGANQYGTDPVVRIEDAKDILPADDHELAFKLYHTTDKKTEISSRFMGPQKWTTTAHYTEHVHVLAPRGHRLATYNNRVSLSCGDCHKFIQVTATEATFAKFSKEDIALDRSLLAKLSANMFVRTLWMVMPTSGFTFIAALLITGLLYAAPDGGYTSEGAKRFLLLGGLGSLAVGAGLRFFYILWAGRNGVILRLGGRTSPFQQDLLRGTSGKLVRMVISVSIKGGSALAAHSVSRIEEEYNRSGAVVVRPYVDTLFKAFNVVGYYVMER